MKLPQLLRTLLAGGLLACAARAAEDPDAPPATAAKTKPLLLVPKDHVLVQRGFVPVGGVKKLYACVVGTPVGLHFAYDCETGALLCVWRGDFVDVSEMWEGRSFNQTARPAGAKVVELASKPMWALFPDRLLEYPRVWPEQTDPLYSSQGYEIERDGTPAFLATYSEMTIRDHIAPSADGQSLTRILTLGGKLSLWETWVLLADADMIVPRPGGFTIGGDALRFDWPAASAHHPVIRVGGRGQQLVLRVTKSTLLEPIVSTLRW